MMQYLLNWQIYVYVTETIAGNRGEAHGIPMETRKRAGRRR